MVRAVTKLKAADNTTFLCLSNANTVFIPTILEDKGLSTLFDEVITNPAEWDSSGLLKLRRRVDPEGPQHNCLVGCQPNMCKGWTQYSITSDLDNTNFPFAGEELTAYLQRKGVEFDRIVYVGDGNNDFCPVLRLRR
jgi:pyridoxal phosphate phosphatase PHOSPHO2